MWAARHEMILRLTCAEVAWAPKSGCDGATSAQSLLHPEGTRDAGVQSCIAGQRGIVLDELSVVVGGVE